MQQVFPGCANHFCQIVGNTSVALQRGGGGGGEALDAYDVSASFSTDRGEKEED